MLAPFLLFIAARVKQLAPAGNGEKSKITIPWFAILFILVAVFNSFHLLPKAVVDMLVTLDTVLLAMAMAATGLNHPRQRTEKSRCEAAADGADAVRLADCWRRRD